MGVIALIPARYASSRFPGKVLARRTGKYLIEHVYERVCRASLIQEVIVVTDDERVGRACEEFGAPWRMTRSDHASGTDRIAEAAASLDAEVMVNVQGDEPEIDPENVNLVVRVLQEDRQADLATLAAPFEAEEDVENPNVVKVVTNQAGHALYFSRWPIPYERDGRGSRRLHRKHLGLYAYRREALVQFGRWAPTPLEQAEKLEQLRALENGMVIAVAEVGPSAAGIDTPEQYEQFVQRRRRGEAKE